MCGETEQQLKETLHPVFTVLDSPACVMKTNRLLPLLAAVICSQLVQTEAVIPSTPFDLNTCSLNIFGQMKTNLTISTAAGSTQFCFTDQTECIKISGTTEDTATSTFGVVDSDLEESVKAKLPQIKNNATCFLKSDLRSSGTLTRSITFMKFGPQTVMSVTLISNSESNVQINALEAMEVNFTKSGVEDTKYIDLSGCRSEAGEILLPGSDRSRTSGDCTISSCNHQGELITEQACGSLETCVANKCKATYHVCTVTSGQVINFSGQLSSVMDRCLYSVLEPVDNSFVLLAAFEDRRSQTLTFLDRLELVLPKSNDKVSLESSGRVRLNDQIQTLSTNATEVVNGVMLSKDWTGVNLAIPNSDVKIFFDGSTAYIKVPDGAALQGLCGDTASSPTPVSDSRSDLGCEIMPGGDSFPVNRAAGSERCSLLASEKFAKCHDKVPVEPFIQACNLTLSQYPMVDNLNCQYFEAYAQVCKMQYDIDIEGWRSSFGCQKENNQSYCQDHECNTNEFCGESKFKGTTCLCRAIYASEYHSKNTLGDSPTCQENRGSVSLIGCLLEERGINYNLLHLNNENCTGQRDSDTHLVTFSFDSNDTCRTETERNDTFVVFKNSIVSGRANKNSLITRNKFQLDITCTYKKPQIQTLLLHVKTTSMVRQLISESHNYTLVMQAYTDSARQMPMEPDTQLELNQQIWIELRADKLNGELMKLVTESCFVTEKPSPNDTVKYDLIIQGCPNPEDGTVETHNNGVGNSNYFSFQMFQFLNSTSFYLHCNVNLCQNSECEPTCNDISNRRRRALENYLPGGLISMEWLD